MLRSLLEARKAFDRDGIDFAIEKPVFDRLTPLGSCRPDFLCEARSRSTGEIRQLIAQAGHIEIEEHAALQRSLKQIAPTITIEPIDLENGLIYHRLTTGFEQPF